MPFNTTWSEIKDFANGGKLLPQDLDDALADLGNQIAGINVAGGFNEGSNTRRGKFLQAAVGTRTSATYGALSNGPDQVANVVLPTDGMIWFLYQAIWKESVAGAARAALFVDGSQIKYTNIPTALSEAGISTGGPNVPAVLGSSPNFGLQSGGCDAAVAEQTTGVVFGGTGSAGFGAGRCGIWLTAGTHTISVQFKASSGTVSVQNRRMLVRSESY